jgi:uncharacterized membrane protein
MSGVGLLALIYWFGANSYLIDKSVMPLAPASAIAISIGVLVGGWITYDGLCRMLAGKDTLLALIVLVFVMVCAWALFHVFSARAAYVHVGAMIGTMMVGNVFFHIIPGQKKMVDAIRAGREPDARYGAIGKQRSVHNTYFTLPVLFIMISNHYPMTYSHPQGWLVLGLIMVAGVLIRQFFVLRHQHKFMPALPAIAVALLAGVAIWIAPSMRAVGGGEQVTFAKVQSVINERCVPCHAAAPKQEGFVQPPKGVTLETPEQITQHLQKVAETVASRYMPIGNLTGMTDAERALLANWVAQGAATK